MRTHGSAWQLFMAQMIVLSIIEEVRNSAGQLHTPAQRLKAWTVRITCKH